MARRTLRRLAVHCALLEQPAAELPTGCEKDFLGTFLTFAWAKGTQSPLARSSSEVHLLDLVDFILWGIMKLRFCCKVNRSCYVCYWALADCYWAVPSPLPRLKALSWSTNSNSFTWHSASQPARLQAGMRTLAQLVRECRWPRETAREREKERETWKWLEAFLTFFRENVQSV